jgi:hypothetical protein
MNFAEWPQKSISTCNSFAAQGVSEAHAIINRMSGV